MSDYTGSTIDHLNIAVPDLARSVAFYEPVLASIGVTTKLRIDRPDIPQMHGFGIDRKPFFWLVADGTVGTNMHLAFTVESRALVRVFHEAAIAAGAISREAPAVHPEYHPHYYGAFVTDPDGINLEAVCHEEDTD